MPAHITHLLFGEEALCQALGSAAEGILENPEGNFFRFGCQGPDFFYHNQRTRPTALRYGVLIHQGGYGRLVADMVRESRRKGRRPEPEVSAFILGFTTHAFLDRRTHPFINYYSGWVNPRKAETRRYHRCHAFLERILDVQVLKHRRGTDIAGYRFLPRIDCGEELPYPLLKMLVKSLNQSYPQARYKSRDRQRIRNAYRDAVFFYWLTEPGNAHYRRLAREKDLQENNRQRLALFHPLEVPEGIDFLNLSGREWVHPCHGELRSRASFLQLYEDALAETVPVVRAVLDALEAAPEDTGDPAREVPEWVGDASLDTGLDDGGRCTPVHSDPLPLPKLIDALYRE